ncbi:MAG: hypothetical protein WCJ14_01000 [Verrucomicrobiota bacterium]
MNPKLLFAVLLVIFPLAIPPALNAKSEDSGHSKAIEFTCAAWEKLPYPELYYLHGKQYLQLELSAGQRSKVYPLKGVEALELFIRKVSAAGSGISDAAPEYERVAMAPLLKGVKRMLFLIEASKDSKGMPLQLLGMDDTLETFPAGSFRFINQTPHLLRIEFAGVTRDLPQGALKVVTPDLPEAGGFLPAIIQNEDGRKILENRFFAQRTGRELIIISPPAAGRTELVMKFLSDTIPASPTTPRKPSHRK